MNLFETIKARRSVRTFDGRKVTSEDKAKLIAYSQNIKNPYQIPVQFIILDAKENGLSSPVISGEDLYVLAKVANGPYAEEAFGYSFEKFVLYAWTLGIGTTWIGGTFKRDVFEKAADKKENELMLCASPLGYISKKMSLKEMAMRKGVRADHRLPASQLFFDQKFGAPLTETGKTLQEALEMVRLAPSAVNKQPWRIVKAGNSYHFYIEHAKGYNNGSFDIQKIDMGIALCHFMSAAGGKLELVNPKISAPANTEYIATVVLE